MSDDISVVSEFDIAVVGGGLHGVSIAAEAASRGLTVVLLQGNDLGSGPTGSMRSVLRGGLRKLEQWQIAKVNQNCYEIALLKTKAPHLLRFQKFKIIENSKVRSRKRIQRGIKVYSYLLKRQLGKSNVTENFANNDEELFYYDYQLSNARLILSLAQQARLFGAVIRPYQKVIATTRKSDGWLLGIENAKNNEPLSVHAKILINCCGWLASNFLKEILKVPTRCSAKVSHLAHLVIRKPMTFTEGRVFQLDDGKLLYAHSLDEKRFILGPIIAKENTERAKNAALENAMQIWNKATSTLISLADIEHSWWTSRAKPEDPLSNENGIFRECLLDLNNPGKVAPLLNVFGMNTVQHRLIAEQAIEILQAFNKAKKNSAYETQVLPGGDFSEGIEKFRQTYKDIFPESQHPNVERLINTYGSTSAKILKSLLEGSQGKDFGHGLSEAEVRHLIEEEWATCASDILWRRTNLGLLFSEAESCKLDEWVKENI